VETRIERSRAGRIALSALILFTLFSLVVWNAPDSPLRRHVLVATGRYTTALGLDQNWAVFAPNPRTESLRLLAAGQFADGSSAQWALPRGGSVFGAYWDYRWLKWMEWATSDDQRQLWRPTAEYVARRLSRPGRPVENVFLVRETSQNNPPGAATSAGPWIANTYFRERVGSSR
jgi:hypothetical protein